MLAGGMTGPETLCTSAPDPVFVENYELNKRLIGEMANLCERRGIRFVLVCVDWKYRKEDIERERSLDPSFDPGFFERDLAALSDSLNVDYLGLQRIFEQHYEQNRRPLHWTHWNYEGHRVVAAALADKLESIMTPE